MESRLMVGTRQQARATALCEFKHARRQAALEMIISRLRGQSVDLLSYNEIANKLIAQGRSERGLQDIPVSAIVGSVGRYNDFTRSFLPRHDWDAQRFGVCMVATAAFSHAPWLSDVPFDPVEDFLHSLTATVMGFAFAFGVLARLLQREAGDKAGRLLDGMAVAVVTATFLPLLMVSQPEIIGLRQRAMFAIAYIWYGREVGQHNE